MYKKPKNDEKWAWTNHVVGKMGYYRISESLVKRVVRFPKRVEKGITPGTTACMSPYGGSSGGRQPYRGEVWVMYVEVGTKGSTQDQGSTFLKIQGRTLTAPPKKKIITAWRYPGVSPIGEPIPIPEEILAEIGVI